MKRRDFIKFGIISAIRPFISYKQMGFLGGIGWRGRNNLLVNPNIGSQFYMVSILTNAHLESDRPLEDNCDRYKCFACINVCPAKAIKERPEDFDSEKCFGKLREFAKLHSNGMADTGRYVCGICSRACKSKIMI